MATDETTCCKSKPLMAIEKKPLKKGGFLFYEVDSANLAPIFTHLKPWLGLFVLTSILLNFKGRKSKIAVVITAAAFSLLLLEVYFNVHLIPTWIIYLGFFFGAWYNGNFVHFYRFLKSKKNKAAEGIDAS